MNYLMNKKNILALITLSFLSASHALADMTVTDTGNGGWRLPDNTYNLPDQDFGTLVMTIINWMLGFIVLLAILAIIWGSTIYIASSGDQQRVGQAKNTIKYALMGLIMAGLAWAVVNLVVTVFTGIR
jgi:hypothetical protein